MSSLSLSSPPPTFSLYTTSNNTLTTTKLSCLLRLCPSHSPSSISRASSPLSLRPLIGENDGRIVKSRTRCRGLRTVSYAGPLTVRNLQWISTVSSVVLILARGTPVQKSFIVPLFALQAPAGVIAWIKGRYGVWSAFLALLVRLFFYIPGELELPFFAFLLVIVAPYEAMRLRDTKEGAILSLVIAVYLAFQHFSRTSIQKSLDQGSIVATIAVVCITVISLLLLI